MTPAREAWVNGEFGAAVSAYDPGWQQGLAVFETIGVFGGADPLPLWSRHLRRLTDGAARLGIPAELPSELRGVAEELLRRNHGDDILRIQRSASTCCLTTRARPAAAPSQSLVVAEARRHPGDPLAAIKCSSYAFHALARGEAVARGADEAVLVDDAGRVLETTTGNLFLWREDAGSRAAILSTPVDSGSFLAGIGRQVLLDQLAAVSQAVEQRDIHLDELETAVGIFTTNAVHGPRSAALHGRAPAPLPDAVVEAWGRAIGD